MDPNFSTKMIKLLRLMRLFLGERRYLRFIHEPTGCPNTNSRSDWDYGTPVGLPDVLHHVLNDDAVHGGKV